MILFTTLIDLVFSIDHVLNVVFHKFESPFLNSGWNEWSIVVVLGISSIS